MYGRAFKEPKRLLVQRSRYKRGCMFTGLIVKDNLDYSIVVVTVIL